MEANNCSNCYHHQYVELRTGLKWCVDHRHTLCLRCQHQYNLATDSNGGLINCPRCYHRAPPAIASKWNDFVRICEQQNIIARANWDTDAHRPYNMEYLRAESPHCDAYVFFDYWENMSFLRRLRKKTATNVLLRYGYFKQGDDFDQSELHERINACAVQAKCALEYTFEINRLSLVF